MKKIAFFTNLLLLSITTHAQINDCYTFIHQSIDSLKEKYSIHDFVDEIDFSYNDGNCFPNLTRKQQSIIIDEIESMFNQNEFIGLYDVASQLLKKLYKWNSDEDVRKRMVEIWYDKRCYVSFTINSFGNSKDYSERTKQRLLDILSKKWTQEDIDIWKVISEHSLRKNYINSYKEDVKKIIKETNRQGKQIEKILLDSLVQDAIERNMEIDINRPIYENCILMIGSLNDQRFVPALENMLKEYKDHKDYPEIKEACTYALAKLGVQQYLDSVYAQKFVRYEYLGTKEAFLKELDKQFVWNKNSRVFSNQVPRPSALIILEEAIMYHLKNVPQDIKKEFWDLRFVLPEKIEDYDPSKDEQNKESIKTAYKLYNWIKDNSDKWELPSAKDRF